MAVVLILIFAAAAVVAAQFLWAGRRDIGLYGSIGECNRRISTIALLGAAPSSLRVSAASRWEGPSAIGAPPPTVRVIGPDGRPVEVAPSWGSGGFVGRLSGTAGTQPPCAPTNEGLCSEQSSGALRASLGYETDTPGLYGRVPGSGQWSSQRQALRRRKAIFEALLTAFVATFVVGLLPGLKAVLLLSLLCGALLGTYVMMLRKIKLQSTVLSGVDGHGPHE